MKQKSKKAQIEISFNWVFVLIAGAVILFFFVRLIGSEMEFTETATHAKAVSTINAVLTSLQQRPDSVAIEDRINYEINFFCEEGTHRYGIERSSSTLPHQLVFSPSFIGDSRPVAWVKSFNAPFPIGSMVYLTDEKTKYFFVESAVEYGGRLLMDYFYDLIPGNITKQKIDQAQLLQLDDEGFNNYIIIIAGVVDLDNFEFSDRALASKIGGAVKIDPSNKEVVFYEHEGPQLYELKKEKYLFEESIIGAIISGDPELYSCVMDKAFEQIRITSEINLERVKKIQNAYPEGHSCRTHYALITQGPIEQLSQHAKQRNYEGVRDEASAVASLNNRIIQTNCVTLY